jgi:hypothetical protein
VFEGFGREATFDIYGHLFPQSRRQAAVKLQQAMLEVKQNRNGPITSAQSSSRVGVHSR